MKDKIEPQRVRKASLCWNSDQHYQLILGRNVSWHINLFFIDILANYWSIWPSALIGRVSATCWLTDSEHVGGSIFSRSVFNFGGWPKKKPIELMLWTDVDADSASLLSVNVMWNKSWTMLETDQYGCVTCSYINILSSWKRKLKKFLTWPGFKPWPLWWLFT